MKTLTRRRVLAATVVLVVVVVLAGTAGARYFGSSIQEARAESHLKQAFTVGGMAASASAAGGIGALPTAAVAPAAPAPDGPRIVKTGSVDVEVRKRQFGPSFAHLTAIATNLGGFVSSSKTFESSDVPNGTVTVRVPGDRFDELMRQVRGLGKVRAVSSSGEDVTAKFTDLQARLRALQAQRDQYLALLTKAGSISDTLAIRDRLNDVQTQIEQLQGQLKLLDDQTSFATLTVNLAEPGLAPVGPQAEPTGWAKAWHDAVHGFVGGAEAIVAHAGTVLLLLMCAAALVGAGWLGWRTVAARTSAGRLAPEA